MHKLSEIIFRWLPESEWKKWICSEMEEVIGQLKSRGIKIIKLGEENYKSPSAIFFTDKPFHDFDLSDILSKYSTLRYSQHRPNTVVCSAHYVCVTYEPELSGL